MRPRKLIGGETYADTRCLVFECVLGFQVGSARRSVPACGLPGTTQARHLVRPAGLGHQHSVALAERWDDLTDETEYGRLVRRGVSHDESASAFGQGLDHGS